MSLARLLTNELYNPRLFSRPLATIFDDSIFRHTQAMNGWANQATNLYIPRADVSETKKDFRIEAEVPGYSKEDINIEFTDGNTLQISGQTSRRTTSGDGNAASLAPTIEDVPDESVATDSKLDSKEVTPSANQEVETKSYLQEPTYHVTEISSGSFTSIICTAYQH